MAQGEGGGRPTKYRAVFCKQAKQLSKLGATDIELAHFFEVSVFTLNLWKLQHPKFSAAIKLGKAPSDKRVEASLYNRARGYTYEAEEIFLVEEVVRTPAPTAEDPKAEIVTHTKKALRVPVLKHVPPDATSMIFWLKNRRRDRWRDYKAVELTGDARRPIGMTYEQRGPALLQDYYAKIAASALAAPADPAAHSPLGPDGPGDDEPDGDEDLSPR